MRFIFVGLLGCVLASLAAGDGFCESDPGIRGFVEHWEATARSIKSLPRDGEVAAACEELTEGAFDFDAVLQDALPDAMAKLTPVERKTLAAAIARKTTSDCVDHIQDYGGSPFAILGVRVADDGDRLATANVGSTGGRNVHVTWRLRAADQTHWKAVDMIIAGRSLTAGIRDEFNRILANSHGNLAAAVRMMSRRRE